MGFCQQIASYANTGISLGSKADRIPDITEARNIELGLGLQVVLLLHIILLFLFLLIVTCCSRLKF
jgi:hypothetical protein